MFKLVPILLATALAAAPFRAMSIDMNAMAADVEEFADGLCGRIEASGSSIKSQSSGGGGADFELTILKQKLIDIGFEGAVDFISNDYVGLLQKDLANERVNIRDCRLKVWADLRGFISLANNNSSESNESDSNSAKYDLPIEIRVTKARKVAILDGEIELSLDNIRIHAGNKTTLVSLAVQNWPRRVLSLGNWSNFKPVQVFEYRDSNYEVELVHINVEDQIVTVNIVEQ